MDKYELKTLFIRGGAWRVVLLFMDELPTRKQPWDWCHEMWEENEEMFSIPLYILTSGTLKAWPTEYDPSLVTLCKVITNMDWKVTRLILSSSRISDKGLKNVSTVFTQSELYSLTPYGIGLLSQGLEHLCEADQWWMQFNQLKRQWQKVRRWRNNTCVTRSSVLTAN